MTFQREGTENAKPENVERTAHSQTASNFHGSCQGNQEMQKMRLERFVKDLEGPLKGLDLVARLVVSCRGATSRGRVGRCHWASGERRVGKG